LEKNATQFDLICASAAARSSDGVVVAAAVGVIGELGGGVVPDFFPLLQDVSARPATRTAATQDLCIELPFHPVGPHAASPAA
jgi:hypothetical protein